MTTALSFDDALALLKAHEPLDPLTAASLKAHFYLKFTLNSNAMEGNALTLTETYVLLEHGVTAGGKLFVDHLAMVNHHRAMAYFDDLVGEATPLSEAVIQAFHAYLMKWTSEDDTRGCYRTTASLGEETPERLPQVMARLVEDYNKKQGEERSLSAIVHLYRDFMKVAPFKVGNAQVGRLILNLELVKAGYPLILFDPQHWAAFREAEVLAQDGSITRLENEIKASIKAVALEILSVVDPEALPRNEGL